MEESTKGAWTGHGNLNDEGTKKRKVINSKIFRFGCLPIIGLFALLTLIGIFSDPPPAKDNQPIELVDSDDPLHIGMDTVKSLVGKQTPFDKWNTWGTPETQEGTSNQFWVAYLRKANISFASDKKTQTVLFAGFGENSAIKYLKNIEKERTELIEKQFSAWDGSHIELTKVIKKSMNDPGSYEHDQTNYWDMGDHLVVLTSFRGKNAFGGVVRNWVKAKVDIQTGQVLEIIEQGP